MVATTQPLAARIGLDVLRGGGSAADAAVAVAFALFVAEPRSNGVGGDLMAQYWSADEPHPEGLNASGRAPAGMTLKALQEVTDDKMPATGPWSVTVPGALGGLVALHATFGQLPWGDLVEPAARAAEAGVSVGRRTAEDWGRSSSRLPPDSVYREPPAEGDVRANTALASTLHEIAQDGSAIYHGALATTVANYVESLGGPMRTSDLAQHEITWEMPISGEYRGCRVFELGLNTQGSVVITALSLLDRLPRTGDDAVDSERMIRSVALAFELAAETIGDPTDATAALGGNTIEPLRARLDQNARLTGVRFPPGTDTAFSAIADARGNLCALSTSLYDGFGSGVEIPKTGIVLHNRGAGFSLQPGPNMVGPGKRPFHTLIPGMVSTTGHRAALGFVGAFMQPQGQIQVLRRIFDEGFDPQAALDAPRIRLGADGGVGIERGLERLGQALASRGVRVAPLPHYRAGTGQFVAVDGGAMVGGSDGRHDGVARAGTDE